MNSKEIPNKAQILSVIGKITNVRDRALFSVVYLTGARIREIVRRLLPSNITVEPVEEAGNKEFLLINVYTEKRRRNDIYRNIPIPIDTNKEFVAWIQDWAQDKNPVNPLFSISGRHAGRLCHKWLGFNPHFLRHIRTSHLSSAGYSEQELVKWNGWADSRMASRYVHLNWRSLINHKI
jgi:integrase